MISVAEARLAWADRRARSVIMDAAFQNNLLSSRAWVEEKFRARFGQGVWNAEIFSLALYALRGGKALRPALLFAAYQDLTQGGERPPDHVLDMGLALEMIHSYSLVHDDLPSMDNDDFRRGRPTIHRLVPEGRALLVGDALLTGAFEALGLSTALHEGEKSRALREIAVAAGARGMIAGQWLDLEHLGRESFGEKRDEIHRLKTGALFGAALALAVLASARHRGMSGESLEAHLDRARAWGLELGLFFQLSDDLLDGDFGPAGETALRQEATRMRDRLAQQAREWGAGAWIQSLLRFFLERKF